MIEWISGQSFLGNPVMDYLIAVVTFLAGACITKITQYVLLKRLKVWAEKTVTTIDDFLVKLIGKIAIPLVYLGVFYLAVNILSLSPALKKIIDVAVTAILTLFTARLVIALVTYGTEVYWAKRGKDLALERSMDAILKVLRMIIWGLAVTFFLDNLGFKISAVIAGLGIGGIAIALAAQSVLADLFSYFSILFDRPFEIGDFVILGDYMGTIEYIGIKTTRLRSLGGEQLIISNTDLTKSRLRNYKRMGTRRVVFKLGVTYQTSLEQMKKIPGIIEEIINNVKNTKFDRAHFASYGDFSLIIEVVYNVQDRDYNKYMDCNQEINFAIKKEFEAQGIEFAYPTQTLFVSKET